MKLDVGYAPLMQIKRSSSRYTFAIKNFGKIRNILHIPGVQAFIAKSIVY